MNQATRNRLRPEALLLLLALPWMAACEGPQGLVGPEGLAGPAGATACGDCHSTETFITAKTLQWEQSKHAWGGNYARGTSATCAGCHSSEGFTARIAAGLQPNEVTQGEANPTPVKCRTCHQIHTTHTAADWQLRAQEPVTLMISRETYDGGKGNLCASCHQPRGGPPELGSGQVNVSSATWGPHRTQAAMLLGIGAYGESDGPGLHYMAVEDSCVTCHLGPDRIHTLAPQLSACQGCHEGLKSFDRNGVQTEVRALYEELGVLLEARGILSNGRAVVGTYPEGQAGALWNYNYVHYDRSDGVHNPVYTRKLLQESIDALR